MNINCQGIDEKVWIDDQHRKRGDQKKGTEYQKVFGDRVFLIKMHKDQNIDHKEHKL